MEYIFTLKYQLAMEDSDHDDIVERLGAGGCDDALVGVGVAGRLGLEFTREAASADGAMRSALEDVRRIVPSARLIEASPDLVGLTDVAELTGMSRQNMRKLMTRHSGQFPVPVHAGSASLWHLTDMAGWLQQAGYSLSTAIVEVARSASRVNLAKESRRVAQETGETFAALV